MAELTVTAQQLRQKAENLQALNNSLASQIDILEDTEGNLASMWEGEAKDQFHTAFMNDKEQMRNFKNAIDQYVAALEQIADKYANAEQTNASIANTRSYNG